MSATNLDGPGILGAMVAAADAAAAREEAKFARAVETCIAFRRLMREAGEAGRTLTEADVAALWAEAQR